MFLNFGNFNLKAFSRCCYFTYSISPKYYLQLKCYPAAALGIGSELPVMWVWRSGVMGLRKSVFTVPEFLFTHRASIYPSVLTVSVSLFAHCAIVALCSLFLFAHGTWQTSRILPWCWSKATWALRTVAIVNVLLHFTS